VVAYDRFLNVLIEIHRPEGAGGLTAAASYAYFLIDYDAAAFPQSDRPCRAYFRARGFGAALTDRFDEFARQAAVSSYLDAAFLDGMVFTVKPRTNKHAGKTAYAFGHIVNF